MTYQELKNRLEKCEITLKCLQSGKYKEMAPKDLAIKETKLKVLKESLQKQLKEAEETMFVTTKGGDTKAVKMDKKQAQDLKKDPNVVDIDTAKGQDLKEQGVRFSQQETAAIAREVGKALQKALKALGDEVAQMKAKDVEEGSFEIYVQYKNDSEDQFSFYISDDTLHLQDFSFDKELVDVGVKPSGEAIVHVDVLANELQKHFKAMNEAKDLNDPVAVKLRAMAAARAKADSAMANTISKTPIKRNDDMLKKLEAMRAAIMRDMEQEAEPEGGPVADAYGEKLNKIDKAIAKIKGVSKEKEYGVMKEDWGSSDQAAMNQSMHRYLGEPKEFPGLSKIMDAAEDAVDFYWDDWEEYKTDREGLVMNAARAYARKMFPDFMAMAAKMLEPVDESMSDEEWADAEEKARLDKHPEKSTIEKIQALMAAQKKNENASAEEEEKFHKKLDNLVHKTFGKREDEMNEAPEGMYYLKVDLRDARKALALIDDNPAYAKAVEINGSDVYYLSDEELAYDLFMDLTAHDINVYDTNVDYYDEVEDDDLGEDVDASQDGGDLDIGHQDDEPNMLKKDLYDVATYAAKLYKQLDKYDKFDGEVDFPHWWQKKVTLAREYMSAAQHYLEAEEKQPALDQLALEEGVNEGTELYNRNGFQIKRFSGGEKGVMVQITIGDKYIVVPAGEYPFLVRAMQSVQDDLKDMSRQMPRPKNMDEASIGKIQKAHGLVVAKMKELAKLYKAGDKSVVDQLKDLTAKKKQLEKQLDKAVAGTGVGQELDGTIDEEKATYCGACGKTHKKSQSCPK